VADEIGQSQILVVDDSPLNVALLERLLSDWKVHAAKDSASAFRLLDRVRPDLVLLDITTPGMDGFEVCRRIKADPRWCDIPVVFTTEPGNPEKETMGLMLGAVDCIAKPFHAAVVQARVRTHLSLGLARRQLARQNHLLEEEVTKRTAQLERALQQIRDASTETIIRLSRAAEYRDEDTGAHVLRIAHYVGVIARHLSMEQGAIDVLMRAAPLHDVGKIGIPDRILMKPGPLTAEEFDVIKTHPEIGARLLTGSRSEIIRLAELLALTHHERWDGGGYPRGLAGHDIPLPGRILTVADMFDALVSRRPYKEPFPISTSLDIIRQHRGTALDPAVVDGFFRGESEIVEIKTAYEDRNLSPLFGHLPPRRP
jgi:putative two-component system response regulator